MRLEERNGVRVAQAEAAHAASFEQPGLVCAGKLCIVRREVEEKIPEAWGVEERRTVISEMT